MTAKKSGSGKSCSAVILGSELQPARTRRGLEEEQEEEERGSSRDARAPAPILCRAGTGGRGSPGSGQHPSGAQPARFEGGRALFGGD